MAWTSSECKLSYKILSMGDPLTDDEMLTYNRNLYLSRNGNGVSSYLDFSQRVGRKNKGLRRKKKIKFQDLEGSGVSNHANSSLDHPICVSTDATSVVKQNHDNVDDDDCMCSVVAYEGNIITDCVTSSVGCEIEETQVHKLSSVGELSANGSLEVGESQQHNVIPRPETADSVDWKNLMADDLCNAFIVEKSPLRYFMEEMSSGNSLRNTTTIGNEIDREGVYDTIFHLPWRCELLINVGFLVCLDSFLSLLTIMPSRILLLFWKLVNIRSGLFERPSAAELCDFGCFVVLTSGITILELTDISLIYHMIRGQGTIKLYVVYNVLEIFDKLFQSFVGDVLQTLFNSAEGFSNSSENTMFWMWRLISDQTLAIFVTIAHSFILLAQAITLSTCIVAHSNALLALLVSNNFAEIKTNVFKRFSRDNIHSIVYSDSIERFHISAFLSFVLAQNILEGEGPWFSNFVHNALLVYVCEMAVDIIKHSFLAKFNNIKPIVYSEFLEDLCWQILNNKNEGKRKLTFVPLAPACVVIRMVTPIFKAQLPVLWVWMLWGATFVVLGCLKVVAGMTLRKHAVWYLKRCHVRNHHPHLD